MPESFESLGRKLRELLDSARANTPEHHKSFWYHRPENNFPPQTIRVPEAFDGGAEISIACTQTDLGARAQRELVDRWCRVLPTLPVRFVWFHSKTPQELFEAACKIPTLEGLYVKWSSITDLSPLRGPKELRYLRIGTCPSADTVDPLSGLTELRWLELGLPKQVVDLDWLSSLTKLEGLSIVGQEGKRGSMRSLRPLSALTALRWLHVGGIRSDDDSLRPLSALTALKYLVIGNLFPSAEFAWLSQQLPDTYCRGFKPGFPIGSICRSCKGQRLMITGKGISSLCPTCDSRKWDRVVEAFISAALS